MIRRGCVRLDERDGDEFPGIKRVLRVLSEIDGETLRKIDTAHDHKGTLNVSWAIIPDTQDMCRVEAAWSSENECLLEYVFPDGRNFEVMTGETIRTQI